MAQNLMQVYQIPVHQFVPAVSWLHAHKLHYFTRVGFRSCLIQLAGSREDQLRFMGFLGDLWVVRTVTIFPLRQKKLVSEELASWGIQYKRLRNPFAFEIRTEIDERELDRFQKAIREITKKPKGQRGFLKKKQKLTVPDDIASLS